MITPSELGRSVFGAWLLARFNANGLTFFENTVEAFWRSFWVAAIVLPAYAILVTLRYSGVTVGVGAGTAFYVHSVSYIISWIAFPFVMFYVAQMFNRSQWYYRYIVAFNWGVVLWLTLELIVGLVAVSGKVPVVIGFTATAIAFIFTVIYQGFIAHVALQATFSGAAAIVFLYICLGLMIDGWSAKLLQIQPMVSG